MVEWKDEKVDDHSSGVTDLVTSASPDFQEICENLTHNVKLQILSSRDGYRRYTEQQTPSQIRQLFKLEDWILALCYDDPVTPGGDVNGQIFFRLETDVTSPWSQIPTPKDRTSVKFRIGNAANEGFYLYPVPVLDQLVVRAGSNGAGPTYEPVVAVSGNVLTLIVDTARLDADLKYDTGAGLLTFDFFNNAWPVGWNVTLFPDTGSSEEVVFDGDLTVQEELISPPGVYRASVLSDGDGEPLPLFTKEGHIQSAEWQSHLYMAFEPFDKSYSPNPLDPFGKDPIAFPPINNRQPLRKINPIATGAEITTPVYTPTGGSAQLPGTFIGLDLTQSPFSDDYRYQEYTLELEYDAPAIGPTDETFGAVEVWAERSWGRVDSSMPDEQYLQYQVYAGDNPFDSDMAYILVDPNLASVYGLVVPWGKLFLVYHSDKGADPRPRLSYQQAVDAINAAFKEYQTRNLTMGATTYHPSYESFGYYLKQDPKAKTTQIINNAININEWFYADALPEDVPGNFSYEYAFYLRQSYNGLFEGAPREFVFDGPASFLTVRTLSPIGIDPVKGYISAAPVDSDLRSFSRSPIVYGGIDKSINAGGALFDLSNLSGVFARSLNGGDVLYIDEMSKSWYETPTFTLPGNLVDDGWEDKTSYVVPHQSTTPDEELQFEEPSYLNGGTLSYDSLPQGPYYFDIAGQVGYSANVVNNIQRVYESVPGIPHSAPATSFDDLDDEITGLTHFLDKPILSTNNKLTRIEGQRAADGSGRTFLRTISDEFGCIANQSMVVTNVGVFLWSNTGIVFTDGLRAHRVSEHLIERYNGWLRTVRGGTAVIGPRQLRGRYDELNRLIFWSLIDEDGIPFFVVLSLQKGVTTTMPITVHRGIRYSAVDRTTGTVEEIDYFLTHATLYSDDFQRWYRGQGTFLLTADPKWTYDESDIDDLQHPILPFYKSIAFSFGLPTMRKQTSQIMLSLRDLTHHGVSCTPLGWNDLGEQYHRLGNCLNFQHLPWAESYITPSPFDLEQFFRHNDCRWTTETLVSYRRHFGRGLQRQCYKQVGFMALRLKFQEISIETPGVMDLQVTHKSGFPEPTAIVRVMGATLPPELGDASGRFYITWDNVMEPVPICGVENDGTYDYITALTESDPVTSGDYTERWPRVKLYRVFTDQRLDLIGYSLTYRLIGDRTHGAQKSTAKGGFDAGA